MLGGGYVMADATASTSSASSSKDVSGDMANCQVVLTDITKAPTTVTDAQPPTEQPINGNSTWT